MESMGVKTSNIFLFSLQKISSTIDNIVRQVGQQKETVDNPEQPISNPYIVEGQHVLRIPAQGVKKIQYKK